jgi:pyruvate/2-oxoglutarate/acetoin dehydrogenase E1 component
VVDPRTLKPLDAETIVASVKKTGRVLIVHEAARTGGFGGELAAVIAESEAFGYLDAPIVRLAGRDMPIPYNRMLEYHTVPQVENIVEKARDVAKLRV